MNPIEKEQKPQASYCVSIFTVHLNTIASKSTQNSKDIIVMCKIIRHKLSLTLKSKEGNTHTDTCIFWMISIVKFTTSSEIQIASTSEMCTCLMNKCQTRITLYLENQQIQKKASKPI